MHHVFHKRDAIKMTILKDIISSMTRHMSGNFRNRSKLQFFGNVPLQYGGYIHTLLPDHGASNQEATKLFITLSNPILLYIG